SSFGWMGFVVVAGLAPTQSYIFACKTARYDHIKGISPGLFAIIRNAFALDKFQIYQSDSENYTSPVYNDRISNISPALPNRYRAYESQAISDEFVLCPYGSPPSAIREPTVGRIWKRMSPIIHQLYYLMHLNQDLLRFRHFTG